MSANDRIKIAAQHIERIKFFKKVCLVRDAPQKAGHISSAPMDHDIFLSLMAKRYDIRQFCHPNPIAGANLRIRKSIPSGGEAITDCAILKSAPAIERVRPKLLFAISSNNVDIFTPHACNHRVWCTAIGNQVASANGCATRDGEHRFKRLNI